MGFEKSFKERIFNIRDFDFEGNALELFRFQAKENPLYATYLHHLNVNASDVKELTEIPFLPIDFFKHHKILTGNPDVQKVFLSSGTTGQVRSQSHLVDGPFYDAVAERAFEDTFGPLKGIHLLALLPGYLEQGSSSLVHMVKHFIHRTDSDLSAFYLDDMEALHQNIVGLLERGARVMLWGVTHALLRFSERFSGDFPGLMVMETGGMKGKGPELDRKELWTLLGDRMKGISIHSEYGMTELLTQAYCGEDRIFQSPSWMRILTRDVTDPFQLVEENASGGINVIDLANVHTCAFIETQDQGRVYDKGKFEVMGRLQGSEARGCNLMVSGL